MQKRKIKQNTLNKAKNTMSVIALILSVLYFFYIPKPFNFFGVVAFLLIVVVLAMEDKR